MQKSKSLCGKFYVWRRNDGYVAATDGHMPKGWNTQEGKTISFEQLGFFDYWPDAVKCIEENRS